MIPLRILVACEYSQVVAGAFRAKGHNAYSCDILDTEGDPTFHIKDDVLNHLNDGWDILVGFPSCTYLANSGVRWLRTPEGFHYDRFRDMVLACNFFNALLNAPIEKICLENPIQHCYARESIRKYDQIVHPWWFGEPYSKSTCLWLKNLPKLIPTKIVEERDDRIHKCPPGPDRWKIRSRTPVGLGNAMASQWS